MPFAFRIHATSALLTFHKPIFLFNSVKSSLLFSLNLSSPPNFLSKNVKIVHFVLKTVGMDRFAECVTLVEHLTVYH